VPLLDLSQQYRLLSDSIRGEIDEVLQSQQFILGPKVVDFERALAAYCGAKHAIGISSGTDALLDVLLALELGPNDAVITPAYSFFATASCVTRAGATPVFVDIDPATFNLSPDALAGLLESCRRDAEGRALDRAGRIVRAIIPVHLFGLCCEMDAIHRLAGEYRLTVIEDAAQAIGAEYLPADGKVRRAGTMSMAGTLSFYPSKNLGAAGDAGAIICHDDQMAERFRIFRQHGMEPRYFHHVIGGNFRLDALQAAILKVKLPHLESWSAARRAVAARYRDEFDRCGLSKGVTLPAEPYRARGLTNHHIYHQYVVRVPRRNELQKHLTARGIGTAIYYPLGLHEQACFAGLGYQAGDFPETERAARETIALPMYPELTSEMQRFVVETIAEFYA